MTICLGKTPHGFSPAEAHSVSVFVFMFILEKTKAAFGETNRSEFFHFLTSVIPIHHRWETRFDALGGVMVVGLWAGIVFLVRVVLTD